MNLINVQCASMIKYRVFVVFIITCSFYNGKPFFFFQLLWWFRDFLTDPAMRVTESEN
jgi:hypothetical protein